MDERRTDHFAHLRPAVDQPPPAKDDPVVRPDLVERLEEIFPSPALTTGPGLHGAVDLSNSVARWQGQQDVIGYIRNLIRGA